MQSCSHANLSEEEISAAVSPGQLLAVPGEPVQEEEDVARTRHSMTQPGPLPQQSSLPAQVCCLPEGEENEHTAQLTLVITHLSASMYFSSLQTM